LPEELSGRRIVVPETRELGQRVRMLEERGAEAVPCPMIAIRDVPDPEPVEAWLMTGEGLRRLLSVARGIDLEHAFLVALRTTRKITRGRILRIVPILPIDRLVELIEITLAAPRAAKEASREMACVFKSLHNFKNVPQVL
jgi:hypothetical protein